MLDLQKLSRKLDEALERETEESLNQWLSTKVCDNIDMYVGEGDMTLLPSEVINIIAQPIQTINFKQCLNFDNTNASSTDDFAIAA